MKKKKNIKNSGFTRTLSKRKCGGFTLIETLVAVSIFTLSIIALLVVLTQGIADNNYAKRKVIAGYLAQEGIEYMRNMRDTFVLFDPTDSQTGWNAFNTKVAGGVFPSSSVCAQANGDGCYFGDLTASDYTNPLQPMAGLAAMSDRLSSAKSVPTRTRSLPPFLGRRGRGLTA
jgi:type II secretory pathway pseudopilin PulG